MSRCLLCRSLLTCFCSLLLLACQAETKDPKSKYYQDGGNGIRITANGDLDSFCEAGRWFSNTDFYRVQAKEWKP